MGLFHYNLKRIGQAPLLIVFLLGALFSNAVRAEGPLEGIAEITAATSAMVAPGLLMAGQVNVAQTRADASTKISSINAQAAMANARLQSQTAMANGMMMMQTSMMNQQSQTRDLLIQLQYLAYNRAIDAQMAREKMYAQLQMQQNLLALEFKKAELTRLITETNQLAGLSAPSTGPSPSTFQGGMQTGTSQNPMAAALGSNILTSSDNFSSGVTSSLGLKKALGASLGSGSTRRPVRSDLSVFNSESLSGRYSAQGSEEGVYRRSISKTGGRRSPASTLSHH